MIDRFVGEGPITREPPRRGINTISVVRNEGAQDVELKGIWEIKENFAKVPNPILPDLRELQV